MPSVSVKVNPTILNWLMQKAQQGNVGSSVIDLIKNGYPEKRNLLSVKLKL